MVARSPPSPTSRCKELGIDATPHHPERELRGVGARFESETKFRDPLANHWVVDGNLVTGQNQNAGPMVAREMMQTPRRHRPESELDAQQRESVNWRKAHAATSSALQGACVLWVKLAPPTQALVHGSGMALGESKDSHERVVDRPQLVG